MGLIVKCPHCQSTIRTSVAGQVHVSPESTGFSDKNGTEIHLGDVVRAEIREPFRNVHGAWAEYEIGKAAGGYVVLYFRSEKGCVLPFGYTACYMTEYGDDLLPDLKMLLFSDGLVEHPAFELAKDGMTPEDRRSLFSRESGERNRRRNGR